MQSVRSFFLNDPTITVIEDDVVEQFKDLAKLEHDILEATKKGTVLVVASELNHTVDQIVRRICHPKVFWYLPGFINDFNANIVSYQWHIWHVCLYNPTISVNYSR